MADKIRILVEQMMIEMLYFVKKGVFTKFEAKFIIKERENHEYCLTKKSVKLSEILKAIQFEFDIEKKRKIRYQELGLNKEMKKDFQIVRRIIQLYDKLTFKYRYDIKIWKQYLAYCYTIKSKKSFFKAISNALKFNDNSLDLWLLAVYYEFEINNNPFKAREYFHQAIQLNGKKIEFWVHYFQFEVKFIEQILKRKQILTEVQVPNDLQNDFLAFDKKNKSDGIFSNLQYKEDITLLNFIYEQSKSQFQDKQIEFAIQLLAFLKKYSQEWLNPIKQYILSDIQLNENDKYKFQLFQQVNDNNYDQLEIDNFFETFKIQNTLEFYKNLVEQFINKQKINQFSVNNLTCLINKLLYNKQITECLNLIQFSDIKNDDQIINIFKNYIFQQNTHLILKSTEILKNIQSSSDAILIINQILVHLSKKNQFSKQEILDGVLNIIQTIIKQQITDNTIINSLINIIYSNFLIHKDYLQQSLYPLIKYLEKGNQVIIDNIYQKMIGLKNNCPLKIYISYFEQLQKNGQSEKIMELLKRVILWNIKSEEAWLFYIQQEKNLGKIQNCANLYLNALKNIGKETQFFKDQYLEIIQH